MAQADRGRMRRLRWLRRSARLILQNDQLMLVILAVLVGILAGYGAIGFRVLIDVIQYLCYGSGSEQVLSMARALDWWHRLLVPMAGGLAIGVFIHVVLSERRPLGVAEVMAASALDRGRMRLRDGLGAAVASAASIGVGASVGREGPVVHLGAALAGGVARYLRLTPSMARTLLGCAVASAVAASFNAPFAGVFFALEVVVGHYRLAALAPVMIAGVVGTVLTRIHIGDFPAFIVPGADIASYTELPAFMLLGVVAAVAAMVLMYGTMAVADQIARVPVPAWVRPMIGGLGVGAIAAVFPEVIGVGYETTDLALGGGFGLAVLIMLAIAKTAASCLSLGSGFGGGIFSPSLCIGALVGAAFGIVAIGLGPVEQAQVSAYAIVGMGAVAAPVLGAPISTILIMFELTGDHALTIAVMVGVAVSTLLVRHFVGHSFFTWQLDRRGIDLERGRARSAVQEVLVASLMDHKPRRLDGGKPVAALKALFADQPHSRRAPVFIAGKGGELIGQINFADVAQRLYGADSKPDVKLADLSRQCVAVLKPEDRLDNALTLFETSGEEVLPVIADEQSQRLAGMLSYRTALTAHNEALLRFEGAGADHPGAPPDTR